MKYLFLQSFDDFKCSGSECPITCCGNAWKVYIDEKTDKYYQSLTGDIGKRLESCIQRKDGKAWFVFDEHDKCPMLNEKGLCDVQLNIGEEHLSDTCKLYPRYAFDVGDIRFGGVSISCPEVAKYFLTHKDQLLIDFGEDDEHLPQEKDVDWTVFNSAVGAFSASVDIAQNRELAIRERLAVLAIFADRFQAEIDEGSDTKSLISLFSDPGEYMKILSQTGIYSKDYDSKLKYFTETVGYFRLIGKYEKLFPELPGIIEYFSDPAHTQISLQQFADAFAWIDSDENAIWLEQLIVYTVFRYFMQGVDKKRFYDMMMTAIVLVLGIITTMLSFYRIQNNEEASVDYRMLLIAHISRFIEHDLNARDNALEYFKGRGLCDLSYILRLVS